MHLFDDETPMPVGFHRRLEELRVHHILQSIASLLISEALGTLHPLIH